MEIRTKADDPDGPMGVIKATLVEGANYALPATSSAYSVSTNVVDQPEVSITTAYTQVADSDYFTYTVSLNQPATRPITVNLTQPTNFPLTYEAVSSIDFCNR